MAKITEISSPKIGETLPGGLKVKDLTGNSAILQQDFGGAGNIYVHHQDGHGSLRTYGPKHSDGTRTIEKKSW